MKVKRILRFYYFCDSLERALDNIILKRALAAGERSDSERCAEDILTVIDEKRILSDLWIYLDGVIEKLNCGDKSSLKRYAALRGSAKSCPESARREWKRAAVKFRRRARRIDDFADGVRLVGKYYALLAV